MKELVLRLESYTEKSYTANTKHFQSALAELGHSKDRRPNQTKISKFVSLKFQVSSLSFKFEIRNIDGNVDLESEVAKRAAT